MLALHLNLLPPSKKTKLQTLVHYLFIKELLEIIIFTIAVLATAELLGWLVLTESLRGLAESSLLVNGVLSKQNESVKQLNKVIKQVTKAGEGYSPITPKLLELISRMPNDIQLNTISIQRSDHTVALSGIATTREALLRYQNAMDNIPWLEKIPAPTSQLLQKEHVQFELRARLRDDAPPVYTHAK